MPRLLLLIVLLGWQSDFIAAHTAPWSAAGSAQLAAPLSIDDPSLPEMPA